MIWTICAFACAFATEFGRREGETQLLHYPVAPAAFQLAQKVCRSEKPSECQKHLNEYAALHARILSLPAGHKDRRFVVYRCHVGDLCKGLGDQLKGVLGAMRLAMLDNRALLIDAYVLRSLFVESTLKWGIQAQVAVDKSVADLNQYEHELLDFYSNIANQVHLKQLRLSPDALAISYFNVNLPVPPFNSNSSHPEPRIVIVMGNMPSVGDNPVSWECTFRWKDRKTDSFCAFQELFGLSNAIIAPVTKSLDTFTDSIDSWKKFTGPELVRVGIHIRTGDDSLFFKKALNPLFARRQRLKPEYFEIMERGSSFAQELQHSLQSSWQRVVVFFTSDNSQLRTIAEEKYGMLVLPVKPFHAERASKAENVLGAVADWILLTKCDYFFCYNCASGYVESSMVFSPSQCENAHPLCDKYRCGNLGYPCLPASRTHSLSQ